MKENKRGITLIALIISIIVMLILVGVTVTVALNGGLFEKARQGAKETENAKIFEQIQMAVLASKKIEDKIPYEELFDLLDCMKEEELEGEDTQYYDIYKQCIELLQENKPMHVSLVMLGLSGEEYTQKAELLDEGKVIEVYCAIVDCTQDDAFAEYGVSTEEELKTVLTNELTLMGTGFEEEFGENLKNWQNYDLNRRKLLKELEPIIEANKQIEKEELGTNINYDGRNYNYTNDWAVILKYGGVKVTIFGTGEIVGPEEDILEASQDPVPGDITDGGKRTGESQYDPYIIASIEDLVAFSNEVNEGTTYEGKYIELAIDLDFKSDKSYKDSKSNMFGDLNGDGITKGIKEELTDENGKGFTPIGIGKEKSTKAFKGNFNGKYHKIKNIYINNSDSIYLALFARAENATIENLGLERGKIINSNVGDIFIKSNANCVAGIVAGIEDEDYDRAIVKNCFVDLDEIKGINAEFTVIAGIALQAEKIEGCYNKTNIVSNYYASGIAFTSDIVNCYNVGNISVIGGYVYTGGSSSGVIWGYANGIADFGSEIINCYNAGKVLSKNDGNTYDESSENNDLNAEGIGGRENYNCYNLGEINGEYYSWGIGGTYDGFISNCYNVSNITSEYGYAYGISNTVSTQYGGINLINTGTVSGKKGAYGITKNVDKLKNSYYLAGQVYVDGVQKEDDKYAKTQEEITSLVKPVLEVINSTSYTNNYGNNECEGNAFVADTNNINKGLPILKWQVEH